MRRIPLEEFRRSEPVALSADERQVLARLYPGMRIETSPVRESEFHLTPDQHVGMVCLSDLTLEIRPKFPTTSVLFLIAYACEAISWSEDIGEYGHDAELSDIIAVVFARLVERTTRRGLLAGYLTAEEAVSTPRGRILFDEQIRRRMGYSFPVEVRHDEYTTDILENRLLLAGLAALGSLPLRSEHARQELSRAERLFGNVSAVRYERGRVPDVLITRVNGHYRGAISLAKLIIEGVSIDLRDGPSCGSSFLVDMNVVFERFLRRSLRSALDLDEASFPDRPPRLQLDVGGRVSLAPDLCVVRDSRVTWIGDAKYKRLPPSAYQNADLYQLLAYAIATGLPNGTLIYAADAGVNAGNYIVRNAGKVLRAISIDLAAPPAAIRRRVEDIGDQIRASFGGRES
jgi:5-methylcytosine-specific restriction enzyme subunit McrC